MSEVYVLFSVFCQCVDELNSDHTASPCAESLQSDKKDFDTFQLWVSFISKGDMG